MFGTLRDVTDKLINHQSKKKSLWQLQKTIKLHTS